MTVRQLGTAQAWYVDITHGRRKRIKSPDNSKKGAERYEAYIRRRLSDGISLDRILQQSKHEQTFEEFAHFWFKTHVKVYNKPAEIARKDSVLKNKLIPFLGTTPLNQITTLQIEQYKAQMAEKQYANRSINSQLHVLGKCLNDAQEWYGLEKLPKIKLLNVPPDEFDFLTKKECRMILDQMEGLWHDISYTAMKTGLRIGELRALRWQDIQWSNRTLRVRHSWCRYAKALRPPKSGKERSVPLTDDLYNFMSARQCTEGFVFKNQRGRIFGCDELNSELAKACKRAGIRKITCHVLRHTFASHLAMASVPLGAIQELLGHSDIKMTMRYAHLSPSSMKEAVNSLDEDGLSEQHQAVTTL